MKRGVVLLLLLAARVGAAQPEDSWRFVVGGDSRNCGDVVMPVVAAGARSAGAAFYWHLGDFRAIYDFDQDLVAERRARSSRLPTIADYQRTAWDDFIENQLSPFGILPVYLGIGNHELIAPKSRPEYLTQFVDWLNAPPIVRQRLTDDPKDHRLKTYYHWVERGIDFITLDNASPDQFDDEQLLWLERVLARDSSDASVHTIVAGMHEALPDSLAAAHSMSEGAQGVESGRRVYADLLKARAAGKKVYVLASHSHFYFPNVFDTPFWKAHGGVLPGWIIGTTGAVRNALPPGADKTGEAKTNVYGYLLANTSPDGSIRFQFREIAESDVPPDVAQRFTPELVHDCFAGNTNAKPGDAGK